MFGILYHIWYNYEWPPSIKFEAINTFRVKSIASNSMKVVGFDKEGAGYDRAKEVKEFEDTKAGVKGLVDFGILKLPRFLIHPPESLPSSPTSSNNTTSTLQVPVIDFAGYDDDDDESCCRRLKIVREIREASEKWGFFQMVNHGVPASVMDEMLRVIRKSGILVTLR